MNHDNGQIWIFIKISIKLRVSWNVTFISVDEFKFLRDGGKYKESADSGCKRAFDPDYDSFDGEEKQYDGQLFEPVVFNDSCTEFLKKRDELANYFDEGQKEDIFNVI